MPYGKGITIESAARRGKASFARQASGLNVALDGEWDTFGYRAFELDEAERLRDWFLENFPLETPEPEPEPAKTQTKVWVDGHPIKTTLSPAEVANWMDLALASEANPMIELPTEDGTQTFVNALRVTHVRAVQS